MAYHCQECREDYSLCIDLMSKRHHACGMSITVPGTALSDQVSEEIRAMMARRRMSGRELARKLGVSPAWVSYRLTNTQPIDLNDLQRIADVLDVGVLDLLPKRATAGYSQPRVVATIGTPVRTPTWPSPRSPIVRLPSAKPANRPVRQTRPLSRAENRPLLPVTV